MNKAKQIPDGVPVVTPMLVCRDASAEIDFCTTTFGAVELVRAGARTLLLVKTQFWGDRTGRIIDPSGHVWTISTRVEETSAAERNQRWSSIVKS